MISNKPWLQMVAAWTGEEISSPGSGTAICYKVSQLLLLLFITFLSGISTSILISQGSGGEKHGFYSDPPVEIELLKSNICVKESKTHQSGEETKDTPSYLLSAPLLTSLLFPSPTYPPTHHDNLQQIRHFHPKARHLASSPAPIPDVGPRKTSIRHTKTRNNTLKR